MPFRSSRSSTMAPAISLPCMSETIATEGPARPDAASRRQTPGIPVFPAIHGVRSGTGKYTGNSGNLGDAASHSGSCVTIQTSVTQAR